MTVAPSQPGKNRFLVGVDASRSVSAQPTGTELYSRYLIEALLDRAPDRFSFRLYFNQAPPSALSVPTGALRSQPSAIRVIPFPRLWTHLRLSTEMILHRPDLLFVPAHVLPIIHPRRNVITVHDLGYLYFPEAHPPHQRWYLDRSTRWHTRTASHLLADSVATKRDLIDKYHANPDKITVAYPGLDPSIKRVDEPTEIARVKAKYHIAGEYLLYLGTIQPRKNLQRLIDAFCQLPAANRQLLLAGKPGWYSEQLLQHANDRVKFIGYIDALDKNALLSGATAFVFPSLYEGFGFPVLEALACGVPVLCSNTSSLPEVAGDAAVLIDPLEVDDITRGLNSITSNEGLRKKLIERGHQQAQKFTWQACADVV
ncbi:MAG TPA: glycosyltransferase family 1 protein, partial [Anaerolineae bacterium]|nr:glycosyltransferase family 1 protein [Anaerolineae bacterium]